jgi:hypothetical protein
VHLLVCSDRYIFEMHGATIKIKIINVLTLNERCLLDERQREAVTDFKISNFKCVHKRAATIIFVASVRPFARFAVTLDFCRQMSAGSYWMKSDRIASYCTWRATYVYDLSPWLSVITDWLFSVWYALMLKKLVDKGVSSLIDCRRRIATCKIRYRLQISRLNTSSILNQHMHIL